MSSRYRLLNILAFFWWSGWMLTPIAVYAQEKDRGPQGNQQVTQLSNDLTATTRAEVNQGGLRVTTDVPIPVPGVFETRTEVSPGSQASRGNSIPGATRQGARQPARAPGFVLTDEFPSGGANQIVPGGPQTFETRPDGTVKQVGGVAIGGFD